MIQLPPDVSRHIQRRIDALEVGDPRAWPTRVCKEMNALPLHGNQIYLWALRPDGAVLCLDHEAFSLPVEPETDPLILYAVLVKGAETYPELQTLVPPPPPGARLCEACGGTGRGDHHEPPTWGCLTCGGLGCHAPSRPAADWLNRIDRGDRLELRAESSDRRLVVARLAGYYVIAAPGDYWSSPATRAARQELIDRLTCWQPGEQVKPEWKPNPTGTLDPFESLEHSLRFVGTGSGGGWEVDFARQPDGGYRVSETLGNDFDPAGPACPRTSVRRIEAAAARVEVEREMREAARRYSFPAIVPRPETG
jgi:hypothetical protein